MHTVDIGWRGAFTDDEVNRLHATAFDHEPWNDPWNELVGDRSLGWVTARAGDCLVGFTNVVWDGLVHAWLQDVIVSPDRRREGIGLAMVRSASAAARDAGCEWLHVDFDDHLRPFYLDACGFAPTSAGLLDLTASPGPPHA